MTTRRQQIAQAGKILWTLLTGTRAEVTDQVQEIAEDAHEQIERRRRRLGAIPTEGVAEEDDP